MVSAWAGRWADRLGGVGGLAGGRLGAGLDGEGGGGDAGESLSPAVAERSILDDIDLARLDALAGDCCLEAVDMFMHDGFDDG